MIVNNLISGILQSVNQFPLNGGEFDIKRNPKVFYDKEYPLLISIGPNMQHALDALGPFMDEAFDHLFEKLPRGVHERIVTSLENIRGHINMMLARLSPAPEPGIVRDEVTTKVIEKWGQDLREKVDDFLCHSHIVKLEYRLERQVGVNDKDSDANSLNVATEEAAKTLQQLRELTANVASLNAVSDSIKELNGEISYHKWWAFGWLLVLAIGVLMAFRLIIWVSVDGDALYGARFVFKSLPPDSSPGAAFAFGVGKLIVVSFSFGLCVLVGRIYQTHLHNVTVNCQRRVAFMAIRKVMLAINDQDQEIRKQVVALAASSIFCHTNTGFLGKDAADISTLLPVLDAVKSLKGE